MRRTSLRSRLLVLLVAGVSLVALAGGLALDRLVHQRIVAGFDHELLGAAQALATLAKQHEDGLELDFADEFMPQFESRDDPRYFQLQQEDGTLVELSRTFAYVGKGARLAWDPRPSARPRTRDVVLPDGRAGRLVQVDFLPQLAEDLETSGTVASAAGWLREPEDGSLDVHAGVPDGRLIASVVVARERESLDRRLVAVRLALLGTGAALLAAVAGLTALAVAFGLRPLERLARRVGGLDPQGLDERVETGDLPEELQPIASQVNALLERVARNVERERQLTSDIAHDLKTPVAELRALCEVGGRWPEDGEAVRRFFHDAREVALSLERTIERLMSLARHEAGREVVALEPLDLAELVHATSSAFAASAEARGIALRLELVPGLLVASDREKVGSIVGNLIENAVQHSAPGAVVTCVTRDAEDGSVELSVSNAAPHLEAADLPHLFERFWRKDPSRSHGRHAGLGLALSRANADLLGLELVARLAGDGTLAVGLRFPAGTRQSASLQDDDTGSHREEPGAA